MDSSYTRTDTIQRYLLGHGEQAVAELDSQENGRHTVRARENVVSHIILRGGGGGGGKWGKGRWSQVVSQG